MMKNTFWSHFFCNFVAFSWGQMANIPRLSCSVCVFWLLTGQNFTFFVASSMFKEFSRQYNRSFASSSMFKECFRKFQQTLEESMGVSMVQTRPFSFPFQSTDTFCLFVQFKCKAGPFCFQFQSRQSSSDSTFNSIKLKAPTNATNAQSKSHPFCQSNSHNHDWLFSQSTKVGCIEKIKTQKYRNTEMGNIR